MRIGTSNVRSMNQGKLDKMLRDRTVGLLCTDEIRRCVIGFNPVSDRVAIIRMQCKPVNMTVLQVYAPTSTSEEEEMEELYVKVHHVVDDIPRGIVLYVIGENDKVGQNRTRQTEQPEDSDWGNGMNGETNSLNSVVEIISIMQPRIQFV